MRLRPLILAIAVAGLTAAPASAGNLEKAISMSGPQSLRSDNHPNDYRLWGNREYFRQSGTGWVKLWVSWYELQPARPADRAASWAQLNAAVGLHRLDQQVAAANADGVRVMLTIYQAFPTWSSGATGPDPLSSKAAWQKLPNDVSADGPWGWFVGALSSRYAGKVDALEVVNEPNLTYWPQDGIAEKAAAMMRSAAEVSGRYGGQTIAGPATSDHPDPGAQRAGVSTDWQTFTTGVLAALDGWIPPVPVAWSHHNYRDVKYEDPAQTSRAKQVIDLMHAAGWSGGLWLTEGGLNLGTSWPDAAMRQSQAAKIAKNFDAMRSLQDVHMWTQHGLNDVPENSFKSGLRDDFDYGLPGPGAARPAWPAWSNVSGFRPEPFHGGSSPPAPPGPPPPEPGAPPVDPQPLPADPGAVPEPSAPAPEPATGAVPAAQPAIAVTASEAGAPVIAPGELAVPFAPLAAASAPYSGAIAPPPPDCRIQAPVRVSRAIRADSRGRFTLRGVTVSGPCAVRISASTGGHRIASKLLAARPRVRLRVTGMPRRATARVSARIRLVDHGVTVAQRTVGFVVARR